MSRLKIYDLATGTWVYASGNNPVALAADPAFTNRYSTVINHGAVAATARNGTAPCFWIGSVDPTNAVNNDRLYRTDTTGYFVRVAGVWIESGSSRYLSATASQVHTLTAGFATTGTHTNYQDEGLTLTHSDTIGRRLKYTLNLNPYVPGGANVISYALLRDGVQIRTWDLPTEALSTTAVHSCSLIYSEILAATHAGSVYKVQVKAGANNTAVNSFADAGRPRQLMIEDIGT